MTATPDGVVLIEKDMVHENRAAFVGWLRTAWHPYTSNVPAHARAALLEATASRYLQEFPADADGRVHVLSIRLQVEARKP